MSEKEKKVTIEVELESNQFQCKKCKAIHTKSVYAIAQNAMGVTLIFTCDCGYNTTIK